MIQIRKKGRAGGRNEGNKNKGREEGKKKVRNEVTIHM